MKKGKKVLSLFLSFVMLLGLIPFLTVPASAVTYTDGDWQFTETGGQATITAYNGVDNVVVVPSTVHPLSGSCTVVGIGENAFYKNTRITNVTIPNGVTTIGESAFEDCSSLYSVSLPGTITDIGINAFCGCDALADCTLPSGLKTIGMQAFSGTALTSVTIPSTVTSIGTQAFSYCTEMSELKIFAELETFGTGAFMGCWSLTEVVLPEELTEISDGLFDGCSNLRKITMYDGIESIGSFAFRGCSSLEMILYSGYAEDWEQIEIASYGNEGLQNASLNYTPQTYNSGDWTFTVSAARGTATLTKYLGSNTVVTVPSTISGKTVDRLYGTFRGSNLTSVTIPSSVLRIDNGTFRDCEQLTTVSMNNVAVIGRDAFNGCSALQNLMLPSSLQRIEHAAFAASGLKAAKIPLNVTYIGEQAFLSCSSLVSVELYRSLETIGKWAFAYCSSLESVDFYGSFNEWNAISIGEHNEPLTDATFCYTSGSTLYSGTCGKNGNNLTWILKDYGELLTINGTGEMADDDQMPGRLSYDYSRIEIGPDVTSIGSFVFCNRVHLTSVKIPASMTRIGECAFSGCSELYDVSYVGNAAGWNAITIGPGNDELQGSMFTFIEPVAITTQPQNTTAAPGTKVNLTVTATGTGILKYKWQYSTNGTTWNDTSLTGYNTRTLTITASSTVNGRYYHCIVTDENGSVTSNSAKLTVASVTKPAITGQPQNTTAATGTKAYFTVTATGTGLSYKWQYSTNGSNWYDTALTGYNTKTLTVTASAAVNGRYYRCIVTNTAGSVISNSAKLTVLAKPVITAQPQNTSAATGTKAYFTVTATGTGLTYKWQYSVNGTSWNDTSLTGYNTKTLTMTASAAVNGRYYRCIVTNAAGSVISNSAKLTVTSGGPTITSHPVTVTKAPGQKAYFTVAATGTGTLTYKWQYSTNGSTWYDTALTGYNTKTLTVTASAAVNGRYYRCIVTDSKGSTPSNAARLIVSAAGPTITGQPVSVTKPTGQKAYFTVTATGTGTLTYQWQYSTNGTTWYDTALTGYNTKTLTVTASAAVNGRYYRCIVTDSKGSTISSAAKLTVS